MEMKAIGTILAGATVLYAGCLTFADDLSVGAGMVLVGAIIAALPVWQSIRKASTRTGKGKRKTHLKVVNDRDERPTYH